MDIKKIKRMLITRTDRIGDVVLSLPVIGAARKAFPDSYIAMMVAPRVSEIVIDNPCIDEVIVYDKKEKHRGMLATLKFIIQLRRKKFDTAIILHSTARVLFLCFLAGIPRRVGYARGKMDFLLTHRLEYTKRLGQKHETEYSLDILRFLGVEADFTFPRINVKQSDDKKIEAMLTSRGLRKNQNFALIHPGASCFSKMWPYEKFAKVSDMIISSFNMAVIISLSPEQYNIGEKTEGCMENKPILLCDKMTLGEFAALLKRSSIVISNDSGPVHLASSVGTPVISIFTVNDKGLSPERWRPLGDKAVAIHKDAGCKECSAVNCTKNFICLDAITPEEVLEEAGRLLGLDEGRIMEDEGKMREDKGR